MQMIIPDQYLNGVNKPFTITEEHITNGVEPGGTAGQAQMEE